MCEPVTKQEKEETLMIVSILFGIVLLLTSYAEAHQGTDPDHLPDSSRLYGENESHRHKPRALGDPNHDYTLTISELYGWASSGADVELGHFSGYLHRIPFFDRDFATENPSTCYTVDSGIVSMASGDIGISAGTSPTHPFSEEGYSYHPDARTIEGGLVEFVRYGGGFDYETAPFSDSRGEYYKYTVTAWDKRDVSGSSCSSPSSSAISKTFRVYVTDEDESSNNPPEIDESDLDNLRIFENAPVGTVVCCDWPDVEDLEDIDGNRSAWKYELLGADASKFRMLSGGVDPGNGQPNGLMYSKQSFDYESKSRYNLTFQVTDANGGIDEAYFTIRVVDLVNESCSPPTINWPHSPSPSNFTASATHIESVPDVTSWNDPNCSTARNGGGGGSNNGGGSSTGNRGGGRGSSNPRNGGSSSGGGGGSVGGSVGNLGSTTGGEIGHVDFCRDFGPCNVGEGDCDNSSECGNGLECSWNVGKNYGIPANYDVCEATEGHSGHVDYCRDYGPCNKGEGDCDGNSKCESGLKCNVDVGESYGFPSNYDVCEATANQNGHVDYCRDYGPCNEEQGDCDSNSECRNGLRCSWNVGIDYGFPAKYDVCE